MRTITRRHTRDDKVWEVNIKGEVGNIYIIVNKSWDGHWYYGMDVYDSKGGCRYRDDIRYGNKGIYHNLRSIFFVIRQKIEDMEETAKIFKQLI